MKVRELMLALRQYDPDAEVWVEWEEGREGDIDHVRPDGGDPVISRVQRAQGGSSQDRLDQLMDQIGEIKAEIRDLMS